MRAFWGFGSTEFRAYGNSCSTFDHLKFAFYALRNVKTVKTGWQPSCSTAPYFGAPRCHVQRRVILKGSRDIVTRVTGKLTKFIMKAGSCTC